MTILVYFQYGDDEFAFQAEAVPRIGETLEYHLEFDEENDCFPEGDWISKHRRWRVDSVHHHLRSDAHTITCDLSKA